MIVQFQRIKADSFKAQVAYVKQKFGHSPSCLPSVERWVSALGSIQDAPEVRETADWPTLSQAQRSLVDQRITCAEETANSFLPLADGEVIEADEYSFLTTPWDGIPTGTPVLRRTTNQAVILCFFDELQVFPDRGTLFRLALREESENNDVAFEDAHGPLGFGIETIALKIGGALLSKLASLAIEQVMGSSIPQYFGQVYDDIRKIVAQELDIHMIKQLRNTFGGAQAWNNNEYLPMKQSGKPADELEAAMRTQQIPFYDHLAKLTDQTVAQVALSEFLIGASLHLAFVQELHVVTRLDSWRVTLSKNAKMYADHVQSTWPKLVAAREAQFTLVNDKDCEPVNGYAKCTAYYASYDSLTRTEGRRFFYTASDKDSENNAKTRANNDIVTRKAAGVATLHSEVGKPMDVIATWRQLQ